jgi:hypothetical protein
VAQGSVPDSLRPVVACRLPLRNRQHRPRVDLLRSRRGNAPGQESRTSYESGSVSVFLRTHLRAFRLGLATLLLNSCAGGLAGWHRASGPLPASFPPRQQVQVWQGTRHTLWHGVQVQSDTIGGIPFQRGLDCDTCRQRLPLVAIDSVRLGSLERVGWIVAASPWLISATLLICLRASWGSD